MTTTDQTTVLEQIDARLASSDPATQPLLAGLAQGRLSRDEVRAFASQYFHLVDALPRFVSTVHSVTVDDAHIRRTLLNILVPLELNPPSASDLWLQTCAALGLFSDSVRSGQPTTATVACLGDFEYLCQAGTVQGVAALYAWMSRLPRVCRLEKAALAEHYDLSSGPGVQFFDVIGFQAESHARALRSTLSQLLERHPEAQFAAVDAVHSAITAVEGLYVGALATR
jgi:pyrroloquinoline-quinone synthase